LEFRRVLFRSRFGERLVFPKPFAEVLAQQIDVEGSVAVEGGGVEFDGADHARASFTVGVAVVDSGVVVEFVLYRVHADRVGDLGGGVDVDVSAVGDHASEQGDVDGVAGGGRLFSPLFVVFVLEKRLDVGAAFESEFSQAVELAVAEEHQVGGFGGRSGFAFLLCCVGFALGHFDLATGGGLNGFRGQGPGVLLVDGIVVAADPFGQHFSDPLGAHTEVFRGEQGVEGHAGGAFPRLAGHAGAAHPAVVGGLGGAGVVPVEVAGRDGLQDVQVENGAVHELSFSVVVVESGFWVVLGR